MSTRFPLLVHFAADSLICWCPDVCSLSFRQVTISVELCCAGLEAPRSRTRLGLALDAALEAKVGGVVCACPLPWALGLPLFGGGWEDGVCTPLTLGARSVTALDSAVMVLLILESSAWS